jgi:uncharacterized protein YdeI (YjbR/CyaY-like superfamily)
MPKFFATSRAFRAWLEKNHDRADELVVGFYKKGSGKPSITWPESVDQALCFGWIDGVRKGIDAESYQIRFTPRRRGSIWSAINIKRVEELKKLGLMTEAGLQAFEARDEAKSRVYSYENLPKKFSPEYEARFRANAAAFEFFSKQPPGYRHQMTYRVMSAKKEETRLKRLEKLIEASERGERL